MRNAYLQMCDFVSRFRILKGGKISLVVSAFIAGTTLMHAAPTGGVVTSGTASIAQSGSVTNITQSTQKAAINWQGFSIGASEVVNFNQPNVSAITLNRVVGNEKSIIDGALNANGQVFILNSNGLLFSKNASINTAGLVATTMNLSDTDFINGNYNFKGDSSASIINQGTINISDAGYAALFGKEVMNEGIIKATLGKVHLTGASEVTLNLNGNSLVNLTVDKGVLDALVENKGAVYADGGEVYLTTNAVNELLKGVVNNTGIVEANSIDDITGKIEFFAHGGVANVSGTLNAEGGFIETSGEVLLVNEDASIKAKDWLLDPSNITISAAASSGMVLFTPNAGNWSSTLNVNTLIGALNAGSNITVTTFNTPAGGSAGDITVAAPITWTSANKLTLRADNNIYINENITATHDFGQLALYYGQSAVASGNTATYTLASGKSVNLIAGDNFFTKLGSDGIEKTYTVITALGAEFSAGGDLQGMTANLAGNYVLGANIVASATSTWNLDTAIYLGFTPIGNSTTAFSGIFDGLGHSISNLYINRVNESNLGLFGVTNGATIQNVSLSNVYINSENYNIGGLIGEAQNTTVSNVAVGGTVLGYQRVGGLIGSLVTTVGASTITNADTNVAITGSSEVGGLIGSISATEPVTITYSSATGDITIDPFEGDYQLIYIGGLVGYAENTQISKSFATGNIQISLWNPDVFQPYEVTRVGGLVGELSRGDITSSYATGDIAIKTSYDGDFVSDVAVYEVSHIGGLVGFLPYGTITGTQEAPSYAEGDITIDLRDLSDNVRRVNYIGGLAGRIGVNYDDTEGDYDAPTADEKGQTINYAHASGAVHINFGDGDYDYVEDIYGIGGLIGGVVDRNINNSYAIGSLTVNAWGDYDSYAYGGLIGEIKAYFYQDYLLISNSYYTTGTVDVNYYAGDIGGLVGNSLYTNIENSYATGNVIGRNDYDNDEISYRVGGLVGEFESGNIVDSYATGNVIGYRYVGGLVGDMSDGSIIADTIDVKATGSVSGDRRVGGLVGASSNTVYEVANNSKIYATGVVTGGDRSVGGLIGESSGDTLIAPAFDRIYASNTVKGVEQIGGLVGYSYQSTYEYVNALTAIIANDDGNGIEYVGGLIGYSDNDRLNQVKASGTMLLSTGNSLSVGGLIGFSDRTIIDNATASVTFTTPEGGNTEYIGGLVGKLYGYIGTDTKDGYGDGFATSDLATTAMNAYITLMEGQQYIHDEDSDEIATNDGLYYYNVTMYKENVQFGAIYNSYVASNVSGTNYVGGLVGVVQSGGHIEASYATGTVSGTNSVGGLVGAMINAPDTILNSYASGSVTGTDKVGGLVGEIFGSTITNSYAYGTVSGTTNVGGLVGLATTTTINDSYYDKTINSTLTANASNVGKTTTELQTLSTFSENWDIEADTELGSVYPRLAWKIDPEGNTYEKVWVIGQAPAGGGETPAPAPTPDVTSIVNGTSIQPPIIVLDTPRMEQFQTQPQRFNLGGQNFEFISTPMVDTPTQLVGMQEVRGMLGGGAGDIRVPLGQNSLIQLVNGGVRLPNGLEQEFFMAQR